MLEESKTRKTGSRNSPAEISLRPEFSLTLNRGALDLFPGRVGQAQPLDNRNEVLRDDPHCLERHPLIDQVKQVVTTLYRKWSGFLTRQRCRAFEKRVEHGGLDVSPTSSKHPAAA
jgi:hypothetical protein